MVGSYITWTLFARLHVDPFLSLPLDAIALFVIGYALQRGIINRVIRAPLLFTFLLTFGLNLVIVSILLLVFTADFRSVTPSYSGAGLHLGSVTIPYIRLAGLAVALILAGILWLILNRTRIGAGILAVGADRDAAQLVGIDLRHAYALVFAVAAIGLVYVIAAPLTSLDAAQSAGVPLITDRLWFRIATTVAMFVVLASAWNIIGGLTGYASFGNIAFFGLGAYAAGVLVSNERWPFALALLAAPLVAAVFGCLVGIALLRLRGHYFAVATLGVGVAVGEIVNNVPSLGASTGLFLPIVRSDLLFFYLMAGAAVLAVLVTWLILRSRFGYGLLAI